LEAPLPGEKAHELMAPNVRYTGNGTFEKDKARQSSVLILIYPTHHNIVVPFIQRPDYPGAHGGQICLPGGKCENEDTSFWETALRETREELGIDTTEVENLGKLSTIYIPNSNFMVSPQVGFLSHRPVFNPNHFEVSEIFEVPVGDFFLPQKIKKFERKVNDINLEAPYFDANGKQIWGATAMILSEMIEAFRQIAPDWITALHSCNVHTSQESL
jgi:8-oxo-dGTP pyrophosphatase MutT (NUDIX family)